jgi:hypothetical protein
MNMDNNMIFDAGSAPMILEPMKAVLEFE